MIRSSTLRKSLVVASFLMLSLVSWSAAAHFLLNLNVRIFHVEHRSDGLELLVRMPMPYLVADRTGPVGDNGLPAPAPFTTNRLEQERLVHHVDFVQVRQDRNGLGELLSAGLKLTTEGNTLAARVEDVRLYRLGAEPGFATLSEAQASFGSAWPGAEAGEELYVGDAVVDVRLSVAAAGPVNQYELSSTLNPGLPGQEDTANLLLDHGPGGTEIYRARGLLDEPIRASRSSLAAFATFVGEGVRHILEGLDHVLFVLCLTVGAFTFGSLLWRVTGFTLGHSVTLSLGFFGYVPSGAWFVPAVETAIAASIIYAAVIAVMPRFRSGISEQVTFLITGFIGLIHGLGFSFVLQNILKVTSPNIWQSLLAFNLGIELGQLTIVILAGFVLWVAGCINERALRVSRLGVATVSGLMALVWVIDRATSLMLQA